MTKPTRKNFLKAGVFGAVLLFVLAPISIHAAEMVPQGNNPLAYTMTAEDETGYIGQNGLVVEITGSWDDTVQAYQIEFEYDTSKLEYAGYDFTGSIADTYDADYPVGGEFSPGYVKVGAVWFPPVEDMPPAGSGLLAKVLFNVTATEETTTVIDLLDVCAYDASTGTSIYATVTDGTITILESEPIICGDANNDGSVNISDAVYIINYAFGGGPPPVPQVCAGDANGDGSVNISDAVYIINYAFGGGPAPVEDCCDP